VGVIKEGIATLEVVRYGSFSPAAAAGILI
jgi:hypothetical protein